jgi:tetratricopeptide (TPR) repeat protein
MYTLLIIAGLFVPLLFSCGKSEQKKSPVVLQGAHQVQKPARSQVPYYPGLIEEYRFLLAEDPHNFAALVALGNAYFDNGNWKKAVEVYHNALLIVPRDADVHSALGTAYRNLGLIDRSLDEYRLALKYEPGHLDTRYRMGDVYAYDKRDYGHAVRVWSELLRLAPNYPGAERIRANITVLNKKLKAEKQ